VTRRNLQFYPRYHRDRRRQRPPSGKKEST
jgi:hypothetical protein